jgi:ADP-ribosylglycohydrolase
VLLGQLAGDALGSQVEFMDGLAIAERYPQRVTDLVDGGPFELLAGQPTDDSEMALVLARAMILCGGHYSKEMFKAYRQWYYSNPFDCGSTIRKALTSGKYPELSRPSTESQANGALMRACPIGLGAWNDADRAVRWALDDASLTHPHPFCVEASQAFIAAIVAGLNGATPQQMLAVALDASGIRTREVLEAAAGWPPANYQENMGWARIALHNAFYRLLHCDSLEQVIVESVQCGGDTDTNAAIAGALAGAHFGRDGVPQRWTKLILSCRPHAAFRGSRQQRPRYLWPTDALDIAERLLGLY